VRRPKSVPVLPPTDITVPGTTPSEVRISPKRQTKARGIPNYRQPENGVATGGTPNHDGLEWLKEQGFRTVLNLLPDESIDQFEPAFVRQSGMEYISLPVTSQSLTQELLARFNDYVDDPQYHRLFIHDSSGSLTGAMWYLHRIVVDKAPQDVARSEATAIGLKNSNTQLWLKITDLLSRRRPG
jgi:protein tyrosine phosphatase (PTP) superfamily phosphohydrolase (DUF442 family)